MQSRHISDLTRYNAGLKLSSGVSFQHMWTRYGHSVGLFHSVQMESLVAYVVACRRNQREHSMITALCAVGKTCKLNRRRIIAGNLMAVRNSLDIVFPPVQGQVGRGRIKGRCYPGEWPFSWSPPPPPRPPEKSVSGWPKNLESHIGNSVCLVPLGGRLFGEVSGGGAREGYGCT